MGFLLSHWHCILPAGAILIGMFLMNRDKSKEKNEKNDSKNSGLLDKNE